MSNKVIQLNENLIKHDLVEVFQIHQKGGKW